MNINKLLLFTGISCLSLNMNLVHASGDMLSFMNKMAAKYGNKKTGQRGTKNVNQQSVDGRVRGGRGAGVKDVSVLNCNDLKLSHRDSVSNTLTSTTSETQSDAFKKNNKIKNSPIINNASTQKENSNKIDSRNQSGIKKVHAKSTGSSSKGSNKQEMSIEKQHVNKPQGISILVESIKDLTLSPENQSSPQNNNITKNSQLNKQKENETNVNDSRQKSSVNPNALIEQKKSTTPPDSDSLYKVPVIKDDNGEFRFSRYVFCGVNFCSNQVVKDLLDKWLDYGHSKMNNDDNLQPEECWFDLAWKISLKLKKTLNIQEIFSLYGNFTNNSNSTDSEKFSQYNVMMLIFLAGVIYGMDNWQCRTFCFKFADINNLLRELGLTNMERAQKILNSTDKFSNNEKMKKFCDDIFSTAAELTKTTIEKIEQNRSLKTNKGNNGDMSSVIPHMIGCENLQSMNNSLLTNNMPLLDGLNNMNTGFSNLNNQQNVTISSNQFQQNNLESQYAKEPKDTKEPQDTKEPEETKCTESETKIEDSVTLSDDMKKFLTEFRELVYGKEIKLPSIEKVEKELIDRGLVVKNNGTDFEFVKGYQCKLDDIVYFYQQLGSLVNIFNKVNLSAERLELVLNTDDKRKIMSGLDTLSVDCGFNVNECVSRYLEGGHNKKQIIADNIDAIAKLMCLLDIYMQIIPAGIEENVWNEKLSPVCYQFNCGLIRTNSQDLYNILNQFISENTEVQHRIGECSQFIQQKAKEYNNNIIQPEDGTKENAEKEEEENKGAKQTSIEQKQENINNNGSEESEKKQDVKHVNGESVNKSDNEDQKLDEKEEKEKTTVKGEGSNDDAMKKSDDKPQQ